MGDIGIRVLVADDHPVVRIGLRRLVESERDMYVVAEAPDGPAACAMATQHTPDVALVDLSLPGGSGLEVADELRVCAPATRAIILAEDEHVPTVRELLEVGALGILPKAVLGEQLAGAIRTVCAGRVYLNGALPDAEPADDDAPALKDHEREVVRLVAQGYTAREIAPRLHLTVKTVESYRARLARRLGFRNRVDLVRYARDTGLLE